MKQEKGENQFQLCPKCNGQGTVSKPPYIAGDVHSWSSSSTSFVCDVCHGAKIISTPTASQSKQVEGKGMSAIAVFNFTTESVSFTVSNHNSSFKETETFLLRLKDEIERQLNNKSNCPFYEKHI